MFKKQSEAKDAQQMSSYETPGWIERFRQRFRRNRPLAAHFLIECLEDRSVPSVSPIGAEFRVNTETTADQSYSDVAMNADGDFVVTWHSDGQDGDGYGVFAQRFSSSGSPIGNEFQVNSYTTGSQGYASVAIDADGNFLIAWQGSGQGGLGAFARRYDVNGAPVGTEFRLNPPSQAIGVDVSATMNANGRSVVTWSAATSGHGDVYGRIYDDNGVAQGSEFRVNPESARDKQYGDGSVAIADNGDFVVVWNEKRFSVSTTVKVFGQRFNALGERQSDEFTINQTSVSQFSKPGIAMDPNGDFVVTWSNNLGVVARNYAADGTPRGDEYRVSTQTSEQSGADVGIDDDGDYLIAWHSNGSSSEIFARSYNSSGVPHGDPFQVNSFATGVQYVPSLAAGSGGRFVTTWTSLHSQDGSGAGVYAQRFVFSSPDQPPTANAGGPYSLLEGSSLQLSGSGSDPEGGPLSFSWDLNNDNDFGDANGQNPSIPWQWFVDRGMADGPRVIDNIRVRVSDGTNSVNSIPTSISISNSVPMAGVNGTLVANSSSEGTIRFTLTASDLSINDQAAPFAFSIDWDEDGQIDQIVSGPTGTIVAHSFGSGAYVVSVIATDKDNGVSEASRNVVFIGTQESDVLWAISFGGTANSLSLIGFQFGGPSLVPRVVSGINGAVMMFGLGGDDLLVGDLVSPQRLILEGESGNDILVGGAGDDVLVASEGNDILIGGGGNDLIEGGVDRDILVGSTGRDIFRGGEGSDVIVAASVAYRDLAGAFYAVQAEWLSGRPIAERVANLSGTGFGPRNNGNTFLLPGVTVLDDSPTAPAVIDQVFGEGDEDWLLFDFADDIAPDAGVGDVLTNLA